MVYQLFALVILAGFYACYFGKMLSQRRRGIRTDQMGRGKTGRVRAIEIAVKCVTALLPAAQVVCIALELTMLPDWARILGVVTGTLGVAAFAAAALCMRDNWRAGVPSQEKTELVTGGIYRISRNPAFLGFDLMYLGILLLFFSWPLCILTALAALLLHIQVVCVEEPHLHRAFGQAYLDYCGKVCRYFGRKS